MLKLEVRSDEVRSPSRSFIISCVGAVSEFLKMGISSSARGSASKINVQLEKKKKKKKTGGLAWFLVELLHVGQTMIIYYYVDRVKRISYL